MAIRVEITDLAYGGRGVGRIDGKVVFVPYTAPGDVVDVEVVSEKKGFSEGIITDLIEPSPDRVKPLCRYYGECGGCNLQHIDYARQVELKGRIFAETVRRIGHVEFECEEPPVPSPSEYGYRSRARFHLDWKARPTEADAPRVGFFREGSNSVVGIDDCVVLTPALNAAYASVRAALAEAAQRGVKGIDSIYAFELTAEPEDGGRGRFAALFHARSAVKAEFEGVLSGVSGLAGFEVRLDPRANFQGTSVFKSGDTAIKYRVFGSEVRASASVFMQANCGANASLVGGALEYAGGGAGSSAIDLYCGSGNITIPLAMAGFDVTGVESVADAITLARRSVPRSTPGRVIFKTERVLDWLKRNLNTLESAPPDVVILDPPRAAEKGVARLVADIRPGRVVYVSCSPPVLARDLAVFSERGYRPEKCRVIDMFPQTCHIEAIACLMPS